MRAVLVISCVFFLFSPTQAQVKSSLTSKQANPKVNIANLYFYQPPKYLLLPDSLEALVVFKKGQDFASEYITLEKKGDKYSFVYTVSDSVAVLLIAIVDANIDLSEYSPYNLLKKKIVDNNNGTGFLVNLHNREGNTFANEPIQLAELLTRWGHFMGLVTYSNQSIIDMYETAYRVHPELKKEDNYLDYLNLLFFEKKDNVKELMLDYASERVKNKTEEKDLLNAVKVYGWLNMRAEKQEIENEILERYPFGQMAKNNFWKQQFEYVPKEKKTAPIILSEMKEYISKFKDSSQNDFFYSRIVSVLFDTAEWNGGLGYQEFISAKSKNAYINNKYAKKLADPLVENPDVSLKIAKMLSRKSLNNMEEEKSKTTGKPDANFIGDYYVYLNTYALILYKLKQYDSAFYYQDLMFRKGKILNTEGLERYAVYAEKVKDLLFVKVFLEEQLLLGINSSKMLAQLQSVYKQLNLPEDRFVTLQKKNNTLADQKNYAVIKKKLGTTTAKDFTLKNLLGNDVTLSAYKGKVVILDFWATWCAPCKASFPAMQILADKYKADTGVVFLFIDVWESKEPGKVKEMVAEYIKENNFSFNVLFDENSKVVEDYRVQAIPKKFVVNKIGDIVFMSDDINYLDDISPVIDAERNKPLF